MRKIERFDKYMTYRGLNDNKVTVQLGLSVGRIGKSRKEGRDLSDDVVEQILNFYTDIDRVWLLTGEGEMLNSSPPKGEASSSDIPATAIAHQPTDGKYIRYWQDLSATGGGVESFDDIKSSFSPIVLPDFRDCTDAVNVIGESMSPTYAPGSVVILKEWVEKFIEFGCPYMLVTKNGNRMIKIVNPGSDAAHITCTSINPAFAPFEVELADILRVYAVKGVINKIMM